MIKFSNIETRKQQTVSCCPFSTSLSLTNLFNYLFIYLFKVDNIKNKHTKDMLLYVIWNYNQLQLFRFLPNMKRSYECIF